MKYDLTRQPTRGAKRTLGDFKDRMFLLLSQKPFEDISVNELCAQANYPRATFYNYFDDKYDLLQYCWIRLAEEIHLDDYRHAPEDRRLDLFFDRIFDFTQQNRRQIHEILLHNPDVGYMFGSFRSFMDAQMRLIFRSCAEAAAAPVPREILADHYSNTILLVWKYCYAGNTACTKEQAHQYLHFLLQSQ